MENCKTAIEKQPEFQVLCENLAKACSTYESLVSDVNRRLNTVSAYCSDIPKAPTPPPQTSPNFVSEMHRLISWVNDNNDSLAHANNHLKELA